MTIDEAIQNATGYQEQLDQALAEIKEYERSSLPWKKVFLKISEAKAMLEWYQGYEKDGVHKAGKIQLLASEAQRLKESSNLGERFSNRTFGNFDPRRDQNAFNICRNYANDDDIFSKKRNSLMLMGGVGSGKTHLAAAIANALIDRGIPVLFGTYSEQLEKIREEYDRTGQKKHLSMMKNTPMLVLDDLGKERKTAWTQQILFDVVNYRYEHFLPVIITTNFLADELANHCEGAVWSRLYEMSSAIVTAGGDYRQ